MILKKHILLNCLSNKRELKGSNKPAGLYPMAGLQREWAFHQRLYLTIWPKCQYWQNGQIDEI